MITGCLCIPHFYRRMVHQMSAVTEKIDAKQVKELREKSGAPMGDCLKALQESKGDLEQAFVVLRKRGMASAQKKASRIHQRGRSRQLHPRRRQDRRTRRAQLRERTSSRAPRTSRSCSRTSRCTSPRADPRYVRKEDVTADDMEREKEIYRAQAAATGKPAPLSRRSSKAR